MKIQKVLLCIPVTIMLTTSVLAQSLGDQTPALDLPLSTPTGTTLFSFTHRFMDIQGKVTNSPTFTLSRGFEKIDASLRYATNSNIGGNFNEWEPSIKYQLATGTLFNSSVAVAYNTAANSLDAEVAGAYHHQHLTILGVGRGFSYGFGVAGPTMALGTRAIWMITPNLGLSADVSKVVASRDFGAIATQYPSFAPVWNLGVLFAIPYSPHTMSLYVTNANTHTLEGRSLGSPNLRVGFDFLVPLGNIQQWKAIFTPVAPAPQAQVTPNTQTMVEIRNFAFQPSQINLQRGSVLTWINRDQIPHSVTSDTGLWDSGMLQTGQSFSKSFDSPGDYTYHCSPHPYMKGRIHVE